TPAAYGNLYWIVLQLLTWPFYKIGWHEMVMILPRQVSLFAYVACFLLFYHMARARGHRSLPALAALLLIATSPMAIYTSSMLQTNTTVAALVVASLALLLRPNPRHRWAAVLFGLAIGVKLTAV